MRPKEGKAIPRGNETVLLVEPEAETRKLAAFMLSKQGYQVLEARDAGQAYQLYEERGAEVDLLLIEALMSQVNGHQLARMLEAKNPRLRVVYISDVEYARMTRRIAARKKLAFVRRPFTMRLLADKVRQVLDQPQARVLRAGA
jgi:two-component system, cell cycle sensor histidine kinase and response regulator CckA